MDRRITYPGAIPLDIDVLSAYQNPMIALGYLMQATVSSFQSPLPTVVCDGLIAQPAISPNETVVVTPGSIMGIGGTNGLSEIDAIAYGSLGTNVNPCVKMGINTTPTTLNFAGLISSLTSGQFMNCLIQAEFAETDGTAIVLPYYDAANPADPYSGPANSGVAQNTIRAQTVTLSIKPGTVSSLAIPSPDSGFVGLWVVYISNGVATITSANISPVGTPPYIGTKVAQTRTKLMSNLSLYVSAATGASDSNSGTSATNPFATPQGAWNALVNNYDLNGFNVTINVGAGTFPAMNCSGQITGYGATSVITVNGAGSSTILNSTGLASSVNAGGGAIVTVTNLKVTGVFGLGCSAGSQLLQGGGVEFGACSAAHYQSTGLILITGNYSITGASGAHFSWGNGGSIIVFGTPTATGSGALAFSNFALGVTGNLNATGLIFSGTGSFTGARYSITGGGFINTGGGGTSFFPGNSAGSTGSGTNIGFYA
jgi:hypothetical protein